MAAQPQKQVRKRLVWLSPYLLAVALMPAFMQIQYSCDRGDTYLLPLQVEVGGFDQIDSFHPDTRYYDIAISGDSVVLRAVTRDATSTASYQLLVDGTPVEGGQLGVGGGEVTLGVAVGQSTLRVSVRATEGGLGHYEVDVTRLPKFACTEQGILDAIAFGGGPHYFDCNGPTTVTTLDEIVIDNDVILDGEGNLAADGNDTHRVFAVPYAVTAELRGFGVVGGNSGSDSGGGIRNWGVLTITASTVSGNAAGTQNQLDCGCGGGIRNAGTMTITNTTVSGNDAVTAGGILNEGMMMITNSTLSGNSDANDFAAAIVNGGELTMTNSTVTAAGGGIANYTTMSVSNSLVGGDCSYIVTPIVSDGHNIESPGDTCGLSDPTDLVNVTTEDLNLGPLADNGGPTMTHALLPGSVAIDHVPASMCVDEKGDPLQTDQRGVARPQGAACDVGAIEFECGFIDCNDGNECTMNACDPAGETCVNDPVVDGTLCGVDGVCEAGACRERSWGTAEELVGTPGGDVQAVAVDSVGNVTAVWLAFTEEINDLWANRYTPSGGWGTAVLLETATLNIFGADVAVDVNGNATALWFRVDGTGLATEMLYNRFTPSGGWEPAFLVSSAFASSPHVAADPDGNVTAAWTQVDNPTSGNTPVANQYNPSGGWGTPVLLNEVDGGSPQDVAVDTNGDATVVWTQGSLSHLWSSRYTTGAGWDVPVALSAESGSTVSAKLAVDPDGNVTVVWHTRDVHTRIFNIRSNRYTPNGWGTAVLLENDSGDALDPEVVVDSNGNVTTVWRQDDGTGIFSIWSNRYVPSTGWGSAVPIEAGAGNAYNPQVAGDLDGNAIATWRQRDESTNTRSDLWANRYTPSGGWGTAELIESNDADDAGVGRVAVDPSGRGLVVWSQSGSIWSNRYE